MSLFSCLVASTCPLCWRKLFHEKDFLNFSWNVQFQLWEKNRRKTFSRKKLSKSFSLLIWWEQIFRGKKKQKHDKKSHEIYYFVKKIQKFSLLQVEPHVWLSEACQLLNPQQIIDPSVFGILKTLQTRLCDCGRIFHRFFRFFDCQSVFVVRSQVRENSVEAGIAWESN